MGFFLSLDFLSPPFILSSLYTLFGSLDFCFILVMLLETGPCYTAPVGLILVYKVQSGLWITTILRFILSSVGSQECTTVPASCFGFDSKHSSNSQRSLASFLIKC